MATTKDKLIKYFEGLDVPTLQKVQRYASLLIIPEEDMLTNVTMAQMVEKAHSLADSLFPEWTDRSKSDFGEFLVELFALFSEKDFWYINAFANEGIFSKMRSYSNAYIKAASLGYAATLCKGSSATFRVTFEAGREVTYGRGALTVKVGSLTFSNDEVFVLPQDSSESTEDIILHEGKQLAEDVTYNGHSIMLRKPNIDIDSIAVTIGDIAYTRVNNFADSGSDSTHFLVIPEEDGSCSIYFGSDGFGVTPSLGTTIQVEYRTCAGSSGNLDVSEAKVEDSLDDRTALLSYMLTGASGGEDAETLTSIKQNAPTYFSNRKAIINERVAQEVLNSYPFIKRSKVWTVGQDVLYSVIPLSGAPEITSSEVSYIEENFTPCLMLGYSSSYVRNSYKDFFLAANPSATGLIVEATVSKGTNMTLMEASIRQVLEDITNPLISADYGDTFSKSATDILMRTKAPGIQAIAFFLKIGTEREVIPDFSLNSTEIFRKIDQDKVEVIINAI